MTVTKEIFMHPDFSKDFSYTFCEMLENIIDAEFDKGDETDFDFIDECADAINALRSGDNAQILPVISRKEFLKKIGFNSGRKFGILISACAAIAVIVLAGGQINAFENITVIQTLSSAVSELFNGEKQVETTASSTTATTTKKASDVVTTEKVLELIGIIVETDDSFKTEYYVGENFSADGIKVLGEYDNGEKRVIGDYIAKASEDFGSQAGYEKIEITAGGFSKNIEVRVIESVETKKLTSIYATFPDETDLTKIQVYAVYSNGDERELSADEYTVTHEENGSLFRKYITVTIEYEGCSCSFDVEKEEQ